jgi:CDP-diglyceride synthetase
MMNQELRKRVITAAILTGFVLLALFLSALYVKGRWFLMVIIFVINSACSFEFARMCVARVSKGEKIKRSLKSTIYFLLPLLPSLLMLLDFSCRADLSSSGMVETAALNLGGYFFISFCLAIAYLILIGRDSLAYFETAAKDLLIGIFQIGFCGSVLMAYCLVQDSWKGLLWLLLVVCFNDAAAYFTGKRLGGPKLAPMISPNKTVSGSIGGLAIGIVVGVLASPLIILLNSWYWSVLFSVLVVILAQFGDLSKSYLKRVHEVKDTGGLLPGHGGVLDRVDGVLLSGPLLFYLAILCSL